MSSPLRIDHLRSRAAPLEMTEEQFRSLGHDLVDRIGSFLGSMPGRPVTPAEPADRVLRAALGAERTLPEKGKQADELLKNVADLLFEHSLFNGHPSFYGYITSSAAPIGMLAELLAAAVNANVGAWKLSPMATEIEAQTIRWLAQFIDYPADCGGLLLSGGNMANLTCFLAARAAKAGWDVRKKHGAAVGPPLLIYASAETHTWIQKAADLTGLGTEAIRWIAGKPRHPSSTLTNEHDSYSSPRNHCRGRRRARAVPSSPVGARPGRRARAGEVDHQRRRSGVGTRAAAHSSRSAWTKACGRLPRSCRWVTSNSSDNRPGGPQPPGCARTSGWPRLVSLLRQREGQHEAAEQERALRLSERALVGAVAVGVAVLGQLVEHGPQRRERAGIVRGHGAADRGEQQRRVHTLVAGRALPASGGMDRVRRGSAVIASASASQRAARSPPGTRLLIARRPAAQISRLCVHSSGSSSQMPASGSCQRSPIAPAAISAARQPSASSRSCPAAAANSSSASPNASSWNCSLAWFPSRRRPHPG